MSDKIALITGQEGAYLAELFLGKGYLVHGIKRCSSSFNTDRVDHLYQDPHEKNPRFMLRYADMTDATNLIRIIQDTRPTEIYNLAAQSHVQISFETPEYTANADALGPLRLLEAIRILGLEKRTRFYQAPTSELYGSAREVPQRETTRSIRALRMASPSFMAFGSRRITESPMGCTPRTRSETFVTRKITRAASTAADKIKRRPIDMCQLHQ
jgi:GDPmannose 4,6-dehydratase